jgi:hypothetical protein
LSTHITIASGLPRERCNSCRKWTVVGDGLRFLQRTGAISATLGDTCPREASATGTLIPCADGRCVVRQKFLGILARKSASELRVHLHSRSREPADI